MKMQSLLSILLCAIMLTGCTSNTPGKPVEVQEMLSFSEGKSGTKKIISHADDIEAIELAVDRAVKRDGIVDIADPHYQMKLSRGQYFVWLNANNTATIMKQNDTHTIYSIDSAEKLIEIFNK